MPYTHAHALAPCSEHFMAGSKFCARTRAQIAERLHESGEMTTSFWGSLGDPGLNCLSRKRTDEEKHRHGKKERKKLGMIPVVPFENYLTSFSLSALTVLHRFCVRYQRGEGYRSRSLCARAVIGRRRGPGAAYPKTLMVPTSPLGVYRISVGSMLSNPSNPLA